QRRDWIEELRQERIPCVTLIERLENEGVNSVVSDYLGGAQAAVTHLVRLGHRRIGYVGAREDATSAGERLRGYRAALAAAGLPPDPALVRGDSLGEASARAGLGDPLALPQPPPAVFCANDFMAVAALKLLRERAAAGARGCRVPEDLAIVGFGNAQ